MLDLSMRSGFLAVLAAFPTTSPGRLDTVNKISSSYSRRRVYREANNTLNHIEMYHEGHHYDAIVSVDGNECLEVLELTGVTHPDISID